MSILHYCKKFADFVNSKRTWGFYFKEIVHNQIKPSLVILDVGCNIRPLLNKHESYALHGIDADESIDMNQASEVFDAFYIERFENFNPSIKYDLIILRKVLEHFENNHLVFEKLKKILKADGKILAVTPSNLHPFSIINQIIPHSLKVLLLKKLMPWVEKGRIGWKAYYHKCNIRAMEKLANKYDLKVARSYFDYNSSSYFAFFPPLFLLIVLYEELVKKLKLKLLCATFVVQLEHC